MFIIDTNGDLVGYSVWEPDLLYAPLVGCYSDGRLVAVTASNLPPEDVQLAGPKRRCWFRLPVTEQVRDRLLDGDPAVKVLRTEDAAPIDMAHGRTPRPLRRVEDFVTSASRRANDLTGFAAFLGAPFAHQLDILFLDFLGRLPDPGARQHYMSQIKGGMSPLTLRNELLASLEFHNRQLTVSDRVGSLVTSPIWWQLAEAEPLDELRAQIPQLSIAELDGLSDRDFASRLLAACSRDEASDGELDEFEALCREQGRNAAAADLVRHAAGDGIFVSLVA